MNKNIFFSDFKSMNLSGINSFCNQNGIQSTGNKSNLLFEIIKFYTFKHPDQLIFEGCLESVNNIYGFLRDINNNFIPTPYDIYVHPKFIKEFDLRSGDIVECKITSPKNEEQKLFTLSSVVSVNGEKKFGNRRSFEDLTPSYPKEQIILENPALDKQHNTICRMIDIVSPVGRGQRTLIVAPPKCGKTSVLHAITLSLIHQKNIKLIIVLVGERPEEVTEMKKIAPGLEIVFSTFDESADNQIKMTEIINERAKRLVESGSDVVILLDSIIRLVRAYNYAVPSSGKIMTGGVDPAALIKPKKFFGSARNIEEGGSLTIIATCLTETGSKMDDFIFEELKGTGNAEIRLNRAISDKRIFPAIDIGQSGARRMDMFVEELSLNKIKILQAFLSNINDPCESTKLLLDRIRTTKTNKELLINLQMNHSN